MDRMFVHECATRSSQFRDDPILKTMTICPMVDGENPEDVIARRFALQADFSPPTATAIALPSACSADDMLFASKMPPLTCSLSRRWLAQHHFPMSHLVQHMPLAPGAALVQDSMLFSVAPSRFEVSELKVWLGALLLAAEASGITSLQIPMPRCHDATQDRALAIAVLSEARAHHGRLHAIWPVFASLEQACAHARHLYDAHRSMLKNSDSIPGEFETDATSRYDEAPTQQLATHAIA